MTSKYDIDTRKYKSNIFFTDRAETEPKVTKIKNFTKTTIIFDKESKNQESKNTSSIKKKNFNKSDIFNRQNIQNIVKTRPLNKSTICLGQESHDEYLVKKNKASNKDYNPDAYYTVQSAFQRKMKNLYPNNPKYEDVTMNTISTFGTFKKEIEENDKKAKDFPESQLTARERKYREHYTNEQVKNYLTEKTNATEESIKSIETGYDPHQDPKNNKVNELKSNIFNDPGKQKTNQKYRARSQEKEEKPQPRSTSMPANDGWKAKIDWRDAKTELVFRKEYYNDKSINCSALQRKIENLKDHFNFPADSSLGNSRYNAEVYIEREQNAIDTELEEIKDCVLDNYSGGKDHKLKKILDMASVFQGKDFYKNSVANVKKKNRPASCFEVRNIKDFDNLQIKEIERIFRNKCIHVFDIKSSGSYTNGNTNGYLSFRIRENTDDQQFAKNFEEIKTKLKNEMGLSVQPQPIRVLRCTSDALPSNIKWHDIQLHNYVNKREEFFEKTNANDGPKNYDKEKLSKCFMRVRRSYKNNQGLFQYVKK